MTSPLRDSWDQETGCNAVVILPWYWKLFLFFPMMTQAKQRSISLFLGLAGCGRRSIFRGVQRVLNTECLETLPSLTAGTKLMCQYLQLSLVQRITPCQGSIPLVLWQG